MSLLCLWGEEIPWKRHALRDVETKAGQGCFSGVQEHKVQHIIDCDDHAIQYGESVDVADWFSSFCAIHDSSDGTLEEEQHAASTPKPKKKRGRPSKKVLQQVRRLVPVILAASCTVGGQAPFAHKSDVCFCQAGHVLLSFC